MSDGGPDPLWEGAILRGKGRPIVKYRDTEVNCAKNSQTDRHAIWVVGSDGPKESCVRWGPVVLRNVAMATNIGSNIAINWFCVDDSN